MQLTKFQPSDFTGKKIAELADVPQMSASSLKAYFDSFPQQLADLLNSRLLDILNSQTDGGAGADYINATTISGIVGTTVQTLLENIATLAQGHTTDISTLISNVTYDSTTGTFTFTRFNGTNPVVVDTPLEKVVTNFTYDQATESLILTYPDGTTTSIPLSSFISEYDFLNSESINFTISNHKVTATINPTYLQTIQAAVESASASATNASTYAGNASTSATNANTSASNASQSASDANTYKTQAQSSATSANDSKLVSEGYAVGKQNGVDVAEGSIYYHNNAKYYSEQASPSNVMQKTTYDTHNKSQDIFDYADSRIFIGSTTPPTGVSFWIDTN